MSETFRLTRRAALLLPLAATGCSLWDRWFGETKEKLPGTRLPVLAPKRGLNVDNPFSRPVTVPEARPEANWPQAGGDATHAPGNIAVGDKVDRAWTASIGTGGGYRRKITARPVVAAGRVFTMDADANVNAFSVKDGGSVWRVEMVGPDDDSTNVGGGVSVDPAAGGGTVYAANGLGVVVALDMATGKQRWRVTLPTPARAAPTIADGRLYIPTIDDRLFALAQDTGKTIWSYQDPPQATTILGLPSPAFAEGLLVGGFGSGDLVCLRAGSGESTWTDGLGSTHAGASLADLSSVRALPVISQSAVFGVSLGGLIVSIDLRSGRRLWQREVTSLETPYLAGDWLYVVTPDAQLAALNRVDGQVAWVSQLPALEDPTDNSSKPVHWVGPVMAGGQLLVAGSAEEMMVVNPLNGAIAGKIPLSAGASVIPSVADRTVFVVTDNGVLTAFH
jgi:outer membrane protein assembly factor BamB